jgi:acyl-CoA thioester hydrolase
VVAKTTLELLAEIHWPGRVDIGTGIVRIGNSSLVIAANLYQQGQLVATSETIVVQVSNITKKSHPISDATKLKLNSFQISLE